MKEIELLLEKMNHLFRNFQYEDPRVNKIELDLMKDYSRQLYDRLVEYELSKRNVTEELNREYKKTHEPVMKPEPLKNEAPKVEMPEVKMQEVKKEEIPLKHAELNKMQETKSKEKKPLILTDEDEAEDTFVNPKLQKEKTFLADKIRNVSGRKDKNVYDLRSAIGINEKFFFIKELFRGDHNAFDKAIRFLNTVTSFDDAKTYIDSELSPHYGWNKNTDEFERLMEVVKVKFE